MTIEGLAEVLDRVIERKREEIKKCFDNYIEAAKNDHPLEANIYKDNEIFERGKLKAFEEVRCFIGKEYGDGALENV